MYYYLYTYLYIYGCRTQELFLLAYVGKWKTLGKNYDPMQRCIQSGRIDVVFWFVLYVKRCAKQLLLRTMLCNLENVIYIFCIYF